MSVVFDEHRAYLTDPIRLARFKAAIEKVLKPGDVVADLGCGFGVLGLLCLQAGAARVYGVDSTRALEVARETFRRAGLDDRYICLSGLTSQIELPERVDLAICDHIGCFGFDYGVTELLSEARARFLKPNGRVIPSRLTLYIAALQSPHCREKLAAWDGPASLGEYRWLREYETNTKHLVTLKADDVVSAPVALGSIDLGAEVREVFSYSARLAIARDALIDGLGGWFDCELADGVSMTNSPLAQDAILREQAFLPIDAPLMVREGEALLVTIMARPAESIVVWTLDAPASGRRFAHSTWKAMILSKDELRHTKGDAPARLTRVGRAQRTVLDLCDDARSVGEIEAAVLRDHPGLFPTRQAISRFVLATLRRNTE